MASLMALATCMAAAPQPGTDLPAGGKVLLSQNDLLQAGPRFQTVGVQGPGFTKALQATIEKAGAQPWDVQFQATTKEPISRGDVLHIRFYARNIQSMTGQAQLAVVYELNQAPHTKSVDISVTAGSEWTPVDIPFTAKQDFKAGGGQLAVRLALAQQVVQLGGLQLLNYGNSVKASDLPRVNMDYAGREANAPWRTAAMERIEKLRKSDMKLIVTDSAGKPIPDAKVSAVLQQHAFGFGTAVSPRLMAQDADGEMYRQKVAELFSTAVIENDLKWGNIVANGYSRGDQAVQWLNDHGIPVRGHCLVWPGQRFLPKQILAMAEKPEELRKAVADHVTETATHYAGKVIDWDVINEPYANHWIQDRLGNEVMVEWFKLAHAADPNAKLFLNDYEILASGNRVGTPHQDHFYNTIKYLKDNGAPIHGIGMQGHFGANLTSPENLLKILDRYAELGLRIKVTELDIRPLDDEQLRADYLRDFHIALFSHPAVDGVLQWGFWDGAHWLPDAALFARDWTIRPHGQAFVDLVHGQWKTKAPGTTDRAGAYGFRGFYGRYEIEVSANGKTQKFAGDLSKGGELKLMME